jgi:hypothetical protein
MPNGFHGSLEEWRRMEAPYIRVDPLLEEFAERHQLQLQKNYHSEANRSLRRDGSVSRSIWIYSTDKYGESETYQVSVIAWQDRGGRRYVKHGILANSVEVAGLAQVLERAWDILASWSEDELHEAKAGGETPEVL